MGTCELCRFWAEGQCRKNAPTIVTVETPKSKMTTPYQESTHQVTCWPATKSWQGCGQFEEK